MQRKVLNYIRVNATYGNGKPAGLQTEPPQWPGHEQRTKWNNYLSAQAKHSFSEMMIHTTRHVWMYGRDTTVDSRATCSKRKVNIITLK